MNVLKEIKAVHIIHRTIVVTLSLIKIPFKKYGGSNKKAGQTLKEKKLYLRHPTSATSPASSTLDRSSHLSGPLDLRFPMCEIHSTHFPFVKLDCFCIAFQLIWPKLSFQQWGTRSPKGSATSLRRHSVEPGARTHIVWPPACTLCLFTQYITSAPGWIFSNWICAF